MALEPGFNSATQVDWELACEREMIIRPLAQAVRLESWQVADASNAIGLGRSATYRLIALFKRRPKTSTLLPAKSGRRHSTRWLDPRVEANEWLPSARYESVRCCVEPAPDGPRNGESYQQSSLPGPNLCKFFDDVGR